MGERIWVCMICGKTSPTRNGGHPDTMRGWDISCSMNAAEVDVSALQPAPAQGDVGSAQVSGETK